MKNKEICELLDSLYPDPKCPLNYSKDYELLIATVLSAQTTDLQVNNVTKELFNKRTIYDIKDMDITEISEIIKSCGNNNKKSKFIKEIARLLVEEHNGIVPNDRAYLESLPGVGRKTANVVLATIFNEPAFAVDTHINRVAKIFGIADENDDIITVEEKLCSFFERKDWGKRHLQMLYFGRYICKSQKPDCSTCKYSSKCKKKKCI